MVRPMLEVDKKCHGAKFWGGGHAEIAKAQAQKRADYCTEKNGIQHRFVKKYERFGGALRDRYEVVAETFKILSAKPKELMFRVGLLLAPYDEKQSAILMAQGLKMISVDVGKSDRSASDQSVRGILRAIR